MQRKVEKVGNLLNEKGELRNKGYSTKLLLRYQRSQIKVPKWRIKEWDYYLIANEDFAVGLTLADYGYIGFISVSFMDFKKGWSKTTSKIKALSLGRLRLPESSRSGDVIYRDKELEMYFLNNGVQRKLKCKMKYFNQDKEFECQFVLKDEPKDSMVLMLPFDKNPKAFCYSQKIIGMKAIGYAKYDNRLYKFNHKPSTAILDWRRGIFPYKNTYYWATANGQLEDKSFGFSVGQGLGNSSLATENALFYDGKAHKLDHVSFTVPKEGHKDAYMKTWTFTSSDQRFQISFIPHLDRHDYLSTGFISADRHQIFGKFNGVVTLDDGIHLQIKDFFGFVNYEINKL